jgi:Zn-dependent protease with chaperone function
MNFFQQQANTKRRTGWLILLFVLAVICLVGLTQLLVMIVLQYGNGSSIQSERMELSWVALTEIAVAITAVITLASLYKMQQLRAGGAAVATLLGGTLLDRSSTQLDEKKILNVVEEMAIASGVAVPPVYILEEESINAFAAGHDSRDAAIGITRGAIQLLSRDELQGVIAHEFSHIFNGDMRINLRLMGWLYGILFIGLVGQFLLNTSSRQRSYNSRNNQGSTAVALIGLGLIIIGYSGTFFGKLIRAAISRQREFLADASAVQYTRNPDGIAGALKKIGGSTSLISHPNAAQASHLFFGDGISLRQSWFATHPPLEERIKAIDAHWRGEFTAVDTRQVDIDKPAIDPNHVNIVDGEIQYTPPPVATAAIAATSVIAALDTVGAPTPAHLSEAQQRITSIPDNLQKLARETWGACAIAHCLLMERNTNNNTQALSLLQQHTQGSITSLCEKIADIVKQLPYTLRLPLLDLCLPSLQLLSPTQRNQFFSAVMAQIQADQHISLFEWSLYRILRHYLAAEKSPAGNITLNSASDSCCTVLSALCLFAHSKNEAEAVFTTAWSQLDLSATRCNLNALTDMSALDKAVRHLQRLPALSKPRLLKACCAAIVDKQQQYAAESIELLRAIADTLDTPIPPIAASTTTAS